MAKVSCVSSNTRQAQAIQRQKEQSSPDHIVRAEKPAPLKIQNSNFSDVENKTKAPPVPSVPAIYKPKVNSARSRKPTGSNLVKARPQGSDFSRVGTGTTSKHAISPLMGMVYRKYDMENPRTSPTRSHATKSIRSLKSGVSYFSNSSHRSSLGPTAGIIAAGLRRYEASSHSNQVSGFIKFLDRIVAADSQRYSHIFPEDEPLWIPISTILGAGMTAFLVAAIVLGDGNGNIGIASVQENPFIGPNTATLVRFGGNVPFITRQTFNVHGWTIASATYMHAGIVHLLINLSFIVIYGPKVDRWYGSIRVILIFFVTGCCSYLASSLIQTGKNVTVGSSGAICGMVGAILAENLKNWDALNHPAIQLGTWGLQAVIFLLLGLAPQFNNVCHSAGLYSGFLCGLAFLPRLLPSERKESSKSLEPYLSWVLTLFGIAGLSLIAGGGLWLLSNGNSLTSKLACGFFFSIQC